MPAGEKVIASSTLRRPAIPYLKNRSLRNPFIRNLHGMDHLEQWLISAIATILAVRIFLELTGYPQLGGSGFHIAHVLWGGLFMAVGTILLFTFLGNKLAQFGSLAGGIGFGLFIDEVGKFVTKDNDYFYQPSVAIMYTVFVILYMFVRWVLTSTRYSETEFLVNSISEMRELVAGRCTEEEKRLILYGLQRSDASDQMVPELIRIVRNVRVNCVSSHGFYSRSRDRLFGWYRNLVARRWFTPAVVIFFLIQILGSFGVIITILFDPGQLLPQLESFGFADWAILASNLISGFFITWGALLLRRSRLAAFKMFERAMLVQIFITQMFLFEKDEFDALPGFIFDLLLLLAIRFIIQRESSEIITSTTADG